MDNSLTMYCPSILLGTRLQSILRLCWYLLILGSTILRFKPFALMRTYLTLPLATGFRLVPQEILEELFFFFLRLPIGQYGPVSQLSRSEERCTGPFNWGEAHCAGEKVKRKIGPFLRKSLKNQTRTRTQQKGAQPATATRNPLARLPGARANEETNPTNKRLHQQILVRLNVLDLQWTIL